MRTDWSECREGERVCGRGGSSRPRRGGPGEDTARVLPGEAGICKEIEFRGEGVTRERLAVETRDPRHTHILARHDTVFAGYLPLGIHLAS